MYCCFVCRFNRLEVVKFFFERGVNFFIGNEFFLILLFYEVVRRGFMEICILLLNDFRIKVIIINYGYILFLYMVCFGGDWVICELILKYGVDVIYILKVIKNILFYFVVWNGDEYNCKFFINVGNCLFFLMYMNYLLWFVLVLRICLK